MWPLPPLENKLVTITFHPQRLTCSWIESTGKRAPLSLRAYKQYPFTNLELEHLVVYNPTRIKQHIVEFLHTYKLTNACIIFGLCGSGIKEKFITVSSAQPSRDNFNIPHTKQIYWDCCYLYPNDTGQFVFYVFTLPHYLLFQYKLLAIHSSLNLIKIAPVRMALFQAYKFLYGQAFRQGQLAKDMIRYHQRIEHVFTPDIINRIIAIPHAVDKHHELPYILEACGLFVSERRAL